MAPAAEVIGAASDAEAEEEDDELRALAPSAPSAPWPAGVPIEALVRALFDRLAREAAAEARREAAAVRQWRIKAGSVQKRNRRQTYLDGRQRRFWERRARRFAERCIARRSLAGLGADAAYSIIAMQHFLDLDIVDCDLAEEKRRSADEYRDGINTQFLLDATRGRYVVGGQVFHYATDTSESEEAFVERLLIAIRAMVPPGLLEPLTTAMSQSGLAALERASLSATRLAVCGGAQDVEYVLDVTSDTLVTLKLQVVRHGFRGYLPVHDDLDGPSGSGGGARCSASGASAIVGGDEEPLSCDAGSRTRKAATVTFAGREVDVLELQEELDILSGGARLPQSDFKMQLNFDKARGTLWRKMAVGSQVAASFSAFAKGLVPRISRGCSACAAGICWPCRRLASHRDVRSPPMKPGPAPAVAQAP
eukprot:TRINITY_DN23148_c0_g6_i1.p1 TRINITY_DN23148_c0_g6~~TRINITY_DN23148_c0_g6_i1.p1  ORF type:complete len:457 (-),score=102.58 TRINITY_DN23148_c0_g6_i1:22-1290(-)